MKSLAAFDIFVSISQTTPAVGAEEIGKLDERPALLWFVTQSFLP